MIRKLVSIIIGLIISIGLFAQAQITTKKLKLEDFPEKTTKIVLGGNIFFDGFLKSEIRSSWRVSPYEFCDLEDFESLKSNANYYFLLLVNQQSKKEDNPGLNALTLVKGGAGSDKGLEKMLEVVSIPIMSAIEANGRENIFLGAFINIIQNHALASIENDYSGYLGLSVNNNNLTKTGNYKIYIADSDLAMDLSEAEIQSFKESGIMIVSDEKAIEVYESRAANTLVSFSVYPTKESIGSECYKMLIDCETSELFYYRTHKISKKNKGGFLLEDLRKISRR